MFAELKQKWLAALNTPQRVIENAILLTETKSPWGWRETLQPKVEGHATDGAAVDLIEPGASGDNRDLTIPESDVVIVEQLDFWYEEAAQGDLTAAINGTKLKLLVNDEEDRRLPEFAVDYFARGDSVLRFGKIPLGWVVPRNQAVKLVMTPSGTAGGSFNLYVDLLVRHEPLWLMEAVGLLDAGSP